MKVSINEVTIDIGRMLLFVVIAEGRLSEIIPVESGSSALVGQGSLQLVNLTKTDSGIYTCTATQSTTNTVTSVVKLTVAGQ